MNRKNADNALSSATFGSKSITNVPKQNTKRLAPGVKSKIPRPANKFILFRSDALQTMDQAHRRSTPQHELSKQIAEMWRNQPKEVQEAYARRAAEVKAQHAAANPGYRFNPIRRENKTSPHTAPQSRSSAASHSATPPEQLMGTPPNSFESFMGNQPSFALPVEPHTFDLSIPEGPIDVIYGRLPSHAEYSNPYPSYGSLQAEHYSSLELAGHNYSTGGFGNFPTTPLTHYNYAPMTAPRRSPPHLNNSTNSPHHSPPPTSPAAGSSTFLGSYGSYSTDTPVSNIPMDGDSPFDLAYLASLTELELEDLDNYMRAVANSYNAHQGE